MTDITIGIDISKAFLYVATYPAGTDGDVETIFQQQQRSQGAGQLARRIYSGTKCVRGY